MSVWWFIVAHIERGVEVVCYWRRAIVGNFWNIAVLSQIVKIGKFRKNRFDETARFDDRNSVLRNECLATFLVQKMRKETQYNNNSFPMIRTAC